MISRKLIEKARVTLEKERGTIRKSWAGRISICLIYPSRYHVGMSNLGFQTVYQCFNSEEDVLCERAFLPDPGELQEYQETGTPLFSLESQKPLFDFDLLAFSLSFENDFLNILTLLDLGRIPLESRDRGPRAPLVIGGGVAAFLNPEPLSDFFDLFILGEGEEVIQEFLAAYRQAFSGRGRKERDNLLGELARVEGVYVPRFYEAAYREDGRIERMTPRPGAPFPVKRRWVRELDRFPARSTLFTPETEFKEMALVEVNRGCPRGCRFCAACYVYSPFRSRSLELLQSLSKESLSYERRIGLMGTAVSDYPQLIPLCESIVSQGAEISLSSMRVDAVSAALIGCLREGKDRSVAVAPEAGSERLRRIVKKGYREEEILKAVDLLVENGFFQIKCYFLIGLPTETDEDVRAILSLVRKIRHHIVSNRKNQQERWRLILSVNPFIPKPVTPFQWFPMEDVRELKRRLKILQMEVRGEKGFHLLHDLPKWAYIQTLLSRGDRRVGRILLAAHQARGDWGRVLRESNVNPDFYVYRPRDLDEVFPWDFIDHGFSKERLKQEYLKAVREGT